MSTYSSLAVYKSGYDFLIRLVVLTKNFDREYKFTIGESIKKEVMEIFGFKSDIPSFKLSSLLK
jgi:hypothetical protein